MEGIFEKGVGNLEIFDLAVKPMINNVISGYNATVFAYGMTSAGKTFTMLGDFQRKSQAGLVMLAVDNIFKQIQKEKEATFKISFSYFEIYNEQVRDLLSKEQKNLMIIEGPSQGVFINELSEHIIFDMK